MRMRKPYSYLGDFIYEQTEMLIKLTGIFCDSILQALNSVYIVGCFGQGFCMFSSLFTVKRIVF